MRLGFHKKSGFLPEPFSKPWLLGSVLLGVLFSFPLMANSQDTFTANSTSITNSNHPTMRGFDPAAITSFNDPFPDTSSPCCGLEDSTQFGNKVASGSSTALIDQRRNSTVSDAGFPLSNRGSILSGPGAVAGQRSNHIESSFDQNVTQQGQIFNLSFSIDSTTDSDGDLVGQATGSFTQVVSDPVSTQGVVRLCSGTFTYDDVNGFQLTSGPNQQC